MYILETERLILRQITTEDAKFILGLVNEPSFIQNIGDRHVRTIDDACNYIVNGPVKSYEKNGFGLWLIVLKETGEAIGMGLSLARHILDELGAKVGTADTQGKGKALVVHIPKDSRAPAQ